MIDEALQTIVSTSLLTLATLNADGSPWVTPVGFTLKDGIFSWWSAADAVHSQNIERDDRVALSIVENSDDNKRAVYVRTHAKATGQTKVNEEWHQTLAEYQANLGELNTETSTPGRFHFDGVAS
jgi:general stress protein 26